MTQLTLQTLYGGNAPHVAGSATSKAAGESVSRVSMGERVEIDIWVHSGGGVCGIPRGRTDDEIEQALNMIHQTASARRRELVLAGKVKDSGRTRATRRGRQATVWVTT